MDRKNLKDGLYVEMNTDKGEILIQLEMEKTPLTVVNFVGLAEGSKDSNLGKKPFYDGLTFHRVIADFMIQGGDPEGTGAGGPGYRFEDEIHPDLKHSEPGILSMANAGPDSNGSQFFITHLATPWLDGKHTVFGKVIEGIDVVNAIAQGDKIKKVEIIRVGEKAEKFEASEKKFQQLRKELSAKESATFQTQIDELIKKFELKDVEVSDSGLVSSVTKPGTGKQAIKGKPVTVHYTGMLADGKIFDSSHNRGTPFTFPLGQGRVIAGWDEAVSMMKEGEERTIILPPNLGYGSQGVGPIPPNSILVFKIEFIKQ